jgi:hypothetical protein
MYQIYTHKRHLKATEATTTASNAADHWPDWQTPLIVDHENLIHKKKYLQLQILFTSVLEGKKLRYVWRNFKCFFTLARQKMHYNPPFRPLQSSADVAWQPLESRINAYAQERDKIVKGFENRWTTTTKNMHCNNFLGHRRRLSSKKFWKFMTGNCVVVKYYAEQRVTKNEWKNKFDA